MTAGKLDFKREQKQLYQPTTEPSVIDVPEMIFIAVDGRGDPNSSAAYAAAVEMLYGLSYGIKMQHKSVFEYVIPPLEGFWSVDAAFFGGGAAITDKSKFVWTMMIRQPEFVTESIFAAAQVALTRKKPALDLSKARWERLTEGLCVQALHVGAYDDEPATIAAMDRYAMAHGYLLDMDGDRRHHEIYLSDPRKTAPERLKTVIRHPIRKGMD